MSGHWSPSKTPERQDISQTNSCASHTSETSDRERFSKKLVKTTLGEENEEGVKSARRRESGTSHRRDNGDIANSWCRRLKGQRAASPSPKTMPMHDGRFLRSLFILKQRDCWSVCGRTTHELGAHGTEQPRHPYAECTCVSNQGSATGQSGKVRDPPQ